MKICDECETVAHCTKNGCIPKVSAKYAMRSALDALEARCGTNAEERGPTGAITLLNAALAQQPAQQQEAYTYSSTQATMCAECGEHKHTPLRIDAMGGYVCLTCIDKKLGSLLGEFGYPEQPAQQEPIYQIKGFDTGNAWHDAIHDAYDMTLSRDRRIVYKSPQPAQRKPLDAGEISRLWKQHTSEDGPHHNPYDDDGLGFARAIEAAHRIKENT